MYRRTVLHGAREPDGMARICVSRRSDRPPGRVARSHQDITVVRVSVLGFRPVRCSWVTF
jgi:hypothetical protein